MPSGEVYFQVGEKDLLRVLEQAGGWWSTRISCPPLGGSLVSPLVSHRDGLKVSRLTNRLDSPWEEPYLDSLLESRHVAKFPVSRVVS
jgi:hypothetical protein